ncbi:ABC transporter substrate-binding protein [Hyphomicrobiales bacterium]|nr:ABC transporter substrate-binding protein [Hyphomicrobiales bacterium]CAH1701280.1 ABC transporter substrate-binding protein [Hyphomicrobiales bacterium]CAI0345243.1 glycine betaine/proline transport system substrate-binding protein [Hyphomicrobiales bacterium]
MKSLLGVAALALGLGLGAPAIACELDRPLKMAGLDYDSAAFHTAVASAIAERGFGCKVERVPGAIAPLVNGLARGDVDIVMEIWMANPVDAWAKAAEAGKVEPLGTTFPDASEGWFVPRYLVLGPDAKAPELKSVQDLKRYKALFADPEEPGKGRFYNCVAGWVCEGINTKKLAVYGLSEDFTNTRGGSGEALVAAIEAALKRKRPVLFYYWGPSWLLGAYDLVKLDEPPFDAGIWAELKASDNPTRATAYPASKVVIGANVELAKKAPQLATFFRNYGTTSDMTSKMLAEAREKGIAPEAQAVAFLRTQPDIWRKWLPADVATKVASSL